MLATIAYVYNYEGDPKTVTLMTQDCNDYMAELVKDHPDRFSGFSTLPMQDVKAAIVELARSMKLGLKGAMIGDNVKEETFDETKLLPVWRVVESLGAVILWHEGGDTTANERAKR